MFCVNVTVQAAVPIQQRTTVGLQGGWRGERTGGWRGELPFDVFGREHADRPSDGIGWIVHLQQVVNITHTELKGLKQVHFLWSMLWIVKDETISRLISLERKRLRPLALGTAAPGMEH